MDNDDVQNYGGLGCWLSLFRVPLFSLFPVAAFSDNSWSNIFINMYLVSCAFYGIMMAVSILIRKTDVFFGNDTEIAIYGGIVFLPGVILGFVIFYLILAPVAIFISYYQ